MKTALKILNELEQQGIIKRYAIGGAVGAMYYTEPFLTKDLDIFVLVPQSSQNTIINFGEIYDYCRQQGYTEFIGQGLVIDNITVDFIPAATDLELEAVQAAKGIEYEDTPTRVLTAEHLTAIMLKTNRDKDRARIRLMQEQGELDMDYFMEILKRHHLLTLWLKFKGK